MGRNVLVTGGAGFIGANFVHYWREQHPSDNVVVLDALTYAGNRNSLALLEKQEGFSLVVGSITDQTLIERLFEQYNVDLVVHFAAESHVDRSIVGPDAFIDTNVVGTHKLLKVAKRFWIDSNSAPTEHRFHHVSTDEVYGTLGQNDPPFTERNQYEPNSPYAASKAASDHLVRSYHHTFGLSVTTSNCSNNYGPMHFPEKLIPLVITNILNNDPLPVYGDGHQIRDWLYVLDHVRGIELTIVNGEPGETYNIGGNNEWRNIDIVRLICQKIDAAFRERPELCDRFPNATAAAVGDAESLITFVDDRLGHDRRYAIDMTRAKQELGFAPLESFETGLGKTIEWYFENTNWWQPLRNRVG